MKGRGTRRRKEKLSDWLSDWNRKMKNDQSERSSDNLI